MAINSSVHKVQLNVADLDQHVYGDYALTVACHPSETDERLMVRLLAFALHAHERLEFGRGLGEQDDPDLWRRDLTGKVEQWIEIGLPDDRRVRKACGVADDVVVMAYGGRAAELWWGKAEPEVRRCRNLEVVVIAPATSAALAKMAAPRMDLQYMVQDGELWFSGGDARITIERSWLMGGPGKR